MEIKTQEQYEVAMRQVDAFMGIETQKDSIEYYKEQLLVADIQIYEAKQANESLARQVEETNKLLAIATEHDEEQMEEIAAGYKRVGDLEARIKELDDQERGR